MKSFQSSEMVCAHGFGCLPGLLPYPPQPGFVWLRLAAVQLPIPLNEVSQKILSKGVGKDGTMRWNLPHQPYPR